MRERIVGARILVQRRGAPLRRVVVGFEPVVAEYDRIDRQGSNVADETLEVVCNLGISWPIGLNRWANGFDLAQVIDFDDIGCDVRSSRLPNQSAGDEN